MIGLGGLLPESSSSAIFIRGGISDDGSTLVGQATYPTSTDGSRTDIWMLTDGQMTSLGWPPGATRVNSVTDLSEDGSVFVVNALNPNRGFIWDRQSGFQFVVAPGTLTAAVSANGDTVVGRHSGLGDRTLPFRWTRENGFIPLPTLPEWPIVSPYDITADGSIIVGEQRRQDLSGRRAFVWDAQHGMQDLRQILIDQHGFTDAQLPPLESADRISPDAMTLYVTSGANFAERWAIFLDKPLVTVVPEPATWALSCIGAIVLFAAICHRRALSRNAGLNSSVLRAREAS